MGAIHVHEFITVDGVVDAPSWTFEYGFDPKMGEAIGAVTAQATGHPARPQHLRDVRAGVVDADRRGRPGRAVLQRHDEVRRVRHAHRARRGGTPRSSAPYDPDAIRKLKDEVDGDLYVSGSITLVRAMLADGLIDGLHLFVYPLTLGGGPAPVPRRRRAGQARARRRPRRYDNGVVYLNYQPAA